MLADVPIHNTPTASGTFAARLSLPSAIITISKSERANFLALRIGRRRLGIGIGGPEQVLGMATGSALAVH